MKPAALLALAALVAATPAAAQPCLTEPEAEAIALVALPDIIRQTGSVCAARLPATSLVRRETSPFLTRYDSEAARAWPTARAAIVKLSVPEATLLLQSDYARPILVNLLVPLIVGRIDVGDCGKIDRLVTLIEPLPPRNTAGLVVTALQHLKAERARGRAVDVPDLPICAARP
jgi:hypothetical protein